MPTWDEDDEGADTSAEDETGEADDAEASEDSEPSEYSGGDAEASDSDEASDEGGSENDEASDDAGSDDASRGDDVDSSEASDDREADDAASDADSGDDAEASDDSDDTASSDSESDDSEASDAEAEPDVTSEGEESDASDDSDSGDDDDDGAARPAKSGAGRSRKKPAKKQALAGVAGGASHKLHRREVDPETGEIVESEVEVEARGTAGALAGGSAGFTDGHGKASGELLLGAGGKVGVHARQRRYDPETGVGTEHSADLELTGTAGVRADGTATVGVDAHGVHAKAVGKVAAGVEADLDLDERDDIDLGAAHLHGHQHVDATAFAGVQARGEAEVRAGVTGVTAVAGGDVFAGVQAEVTVRQDAELDVDGLPRAGVFQKNTLQGQAGAGAAAHVIVGPAGVGAGVSAFAGARGTLKSESGLTLEGLDIFSVEGKVSGLAGAGAEADLHLGAGDDGSIDLGGDVDAALGLGAGAGVHLKVNPGNALKATELVAHKTLDSLARLPTDPQGALQDMAKNTEAVFQGIAGIFKPK